jgi:hypothetical protein
VESEAQNLGSEGTNSGRENLEGFKRYKKAKPMIYFLKYTKTGHLITT